MPLIQKPALRDLYTHMITDQKVDLDKIVSIVGDKKIFGFTTLSSDAVAKKLAAGNLSPADKLALGKAGLDAGETADLKALLADDAFTKLLDPAGKNFLRALIGLEPLAPFGTVAATPAKVEVPAVVVDKTLPSYEAVTKLRELVKTGQLRNMFDAMIGATENPALKAEGEALFAKLPIVKPGMAADDFVKLGLWTSAPKGVAEMEKSARYLPGRQVLCETTCYSKVPSRSDPTYEAQRRKIGSYDAHGTLAVTYRATLVGEDPANKSNFLVKVDGSDAPVSVSKESIFRNNQPHVLAPGYVKSETNRDLPYNGTSWNMNYADPLAKAKMCEIAIKMDDFVGKLDFTKTHVATQGGPAIIFHTGNAEKTVDMQKKCVDVVFRSIDMKYPNHDGRPFTDPGRAPSGNRDVARQAIKGTGMCVQQSTVFGGLLTPFMEVLGVDGQYRSGNCYRNIHGATENVYAPDNESGHGWWQVTFRPSMEMTVTDRTWNQVNLALDNAYGFPYGDRYADRNIQGFIPAKTTATDVNVTGDISVETMDRQFSKVGDGRENHISLTQDNPSP